MLSSQERERIEEEVRHFPDPRAAVSEALMIVQESRGWVSDEGVAEIAELLGMTPDEVDAIATYSDLVFRSPVGRHVILLCDGVSCYVTRYERIQEHLKQTLGIGPGETTSDGEFTLLPVGCLGVCEQAPAMMVDEDSHGNLTPESVDQLIREYKGRTHGGASH